MVDYIFPQSGESLQALFTKLIAKYNDGAEMMSATDKEKLDAYPTYTKLLEKIEENSGGGSTPSECTCPVASISADGILTDSNGNKWKLSPCTEGNGIVSIEYSTPIVSLSYATIPAEGGSVSPTLSYSQIKTTTYSDGSTDTDTINSGATFEWNTESRTGVVIAGATQSTTETLVKTVSLRLTLNGKEVTKTYNVIQSAYEAPSQAITYYVGDSDTINDNTFGNTQGDELVSLSQERTDNTNTEIVVTSSKPVFFILLPTTVELSKFECLYDVTDTENLLEEESYNLPHENITVSETEYKVYGIWISETTAENPTQYTYKIRLKTI